MVGPVGQTSATRTINLRQGARAMSDGLTRRGALGRGSGASPSCAPSRPTHGRARPARRRPPTCARRPRRRSTCSSATCRSRRCATPTSATKQLEEYVITMKPGTADVLPGLQTPCWATTASSRGRRSRPRAGARCRSARSTRAGATQRAPARRRHAARVRRAPARRDPQRRGAAVQVLERRPLGDALVPRPRARRDAPDAVRGLAGFYLLDDKNDQALDLPQATTTSR